MKTISKLLFLISAIISAPFAGGDNLGDFIFHHIGNSDYWHPLPYVTIPLPANFPIGPINLGITLHVLMMLLAVTILIILLKGSSKRKDSAPVTRSGHIIEAIVIYLRDELVVPNLGKKDAAKWLPFFLTIFFFILTLNFIGLIPGMSTTTANFNFTFAMAIMVFITFNLAGMFKNGPIHYFTNLIPSGIPWPVLLILAPIEIAGLFTKAVALGIRLFANMAAGHIIILSLIGLISVINSMWVAPASLAFSLFIMLIEVLVAFLQAYVFTLLATLFVGQAIHQEH